MDSPLEAAAGLVLGCLFGVVFGLVLEQSFARGNFDVEAAMLVTGEPVLWRRSFLLLAVDRGLLARTNGEYRFTHLLIRDHLAACDPAGLAQAIKYRRAELVNE